MRLNNKNSLKLNNCILSLLNEATVTTNNPSSPYISSPSGTGVEYNLTPGNLNPATWNLNPGEDLLRDMSPNQPNGYQGIPRKPANFENLPSDPLFWVHEFGNWTEQYQNENPFPNPSDFPDTPEGWQQFLEAKDNWYRTYYETLKQQSWYAEYERQVRGILTPSQMQQALDWIANLIGQIELAFGFTWTPAYAPPFLGPILGVLGDIGSIMWLVSQLMTVYDEGHWEEIPFLGTQWWNDWFSDRPSVTFDDYAPYLPNELDRQAGQLFGIRPTDAYQLGSDYVDDLADSLWRRWHGYWPGNPSTWRWGGPGSWE
jgi:hypothetical protein